MRRPGVVLPMGHGPRGNMRIEQASDAGTILLRLWRYLTPYRRRLYAVLAGVALYSGLALLGPYFMGRAIDEAIGERDASELVYFASSMLLAYVGSNLVQWLSNREMARLSQRALQSIRADLFAHLQRLPMSYFDRQPPGDLMSRLTNDVDAINQAMAQNVTALLASVLSMAGIVGAMFILDYRLATAALLVVPLMLWFSRFVAVYTRRGFREVQQSVGALQGDLEEVVNGQKVIVAFRRGDAVIERFRQRNEEVYRASVQANTYALLLMPLTAVLGNLFVIVLTGLGGWLALRGLVTVGVIATFINYSQNFVGPLRQLSNLYNTIQSALAGAERVFQAMNEPPEVDDGKRRLGKVESAEVRFEHVTFGYVPGRPAIKDLTLTAKPGELIALVGPTGAGKTTVVNLLTRAYELDEGRITIGGMDIAEVPKAELRRSLGIVLQETVLFSASVMENIRYGRLDATDAEVIEAAKLAEADHFIRQLPNGYETVLAERGDNLSRGQRQLLSIARTLLSDPAILILDEATSSVDTRTEARIQRALQRLMEGRTSFVIAHRLSTIRNAQQVLVIKAGAVVERGTHEQLLQLQGVYHQLYTSQFKGITAE